MNQTEILINVIPIITAIALGYVLTKIKLMDENMVDAFKKIVVNVTLPAGLFMSFVKIKFETKFLIIFLSVFVTCGALYYIGKLIAKIFKIESKYFPLLMTGFEAGMIGYALFTSVFGADAAADFGIVDIGHVTFIFLVFIPIVINLNNEDQSSGGIKSSLKFAAKSPVIWAIVLGVLGSLINLSAYENTLGYTALNDTLSFISAPTGILICLVIGNGLKFTLKGLKFEVITALVKVVIAFVFALLLANFVLKPLDVDEQIITALYALFVLPAPFAIPVYVQNPKEEDMAYVSNTLSIGSVVGVLCFMIVVMLGL